MKTSLSLVNGFIQMEIVMKEVMNLINLMVMENGLSLMEM